MVEDTNLKVDETTKSEGCFFSLISFVLKFLRVLVPLRILIYNEKVQNYHYSELGGFGSEIIKKVNFNLILK